MTWAPWVGFAIGILLLMSTGVSVVRVLVVPRPPSREAVSRAVLAAVRASFRLAARRLATYESKDRLLTVAEPVALLALLTWWVGLTLVGWALILWPVMGAGLGPAFEEAGSFMFTLGFALPHHPGTVAVNLLAAATGIVIVALQIAYLPALYASFNRREVLVTMLASRAGEPAWGPELLARHQLVGIMDDLPGFYSAWEAWAADVAESHTNYPSLLWFRSPQPLYSWLIGLLAVLDSAAMYLALSPSRAPSQARLSLRMGFYALREIASVEGIDYDPDPGPDQPIDLGWEEFRGAVARLELAGFPAERSAEEAWPHFRGWRVNYEHVAYALADRLMAPPGPWSGPRTRLPVAEIPPRRPLDRRPGSR
ncbi:MAG: hypothetical protein ACRDZQ_03500, partial [Acidimicrobiales bacterium]